MAVIKSLIWDDWNRDHLSRHQITPEEVEEVCHSKHRAVQSYRKRILIMGKTNNRRTICIVLSPEDDDLEKYGEGVYYVVTAFEKEVKT
jgi:uncharacterized DUF497 family protein